MFSKLARWPRYSIVFVFVLACLAIAQHAFGYFYQPINVRNAFHLSFAQAGWAVPAHFFGAGLALLLLPWQLSTHLRRRQPRLHRIGGGLYVLGVAIAGVAGLLLAPRAQGGWPTGLSFALLALIWLTVTGLALAHALRGRVAEHRRWMLRSAALTFAAVTLRIYLNFGIAVLGWTFSSAYLFAAWACWTLNLLAVEAWLHWPSRRPAEAQADGTGSVSGSAGA